MAGKTKTQILDEKLKEKEIDNYESSLDVDKMKALTELLSATIPQRTNEDSSETGWLSVFNERGLEILTAKAIEIAKRF